MKTRIVVLAVLLALALVWVTYARADGQSMTARDKMNGDTVTITNEPCTNKTVLALLAAAEVPPENIKFLRAGSAVIGGVPFAMCWLRRRDGVVAPIYEDGETGLIPGGAFEQDVRS